MSARPIVLLAAVLLLALPAVAAAAIKPIPRPEDTTTPAKTPAKQPVNQTQQPVNRPVVNPPPAPPSPPDTSSTTGTGTTGTGTTATETPAVTEKVEAPVVVTDVEGGRDQSGVAAPVIPPPEPTPLALVAASEIVPSQDTSTPSWKIALLALLAAGEAFLIVRLVRHRPGGGLSPAQQ